MTGLMGVHEIAQELGLSRQRVHQLAHEPDFPAPAAHLHAGAIWRRSDIIEWRTTMRNMSTNVPNVPPRDPDYPRDDPYDADAVRFLLGQAGASGWSRVSLMEHLRGQSRLSTERIRAARAFGELHGVAVRQHSDGKTAHLFRSDKTAPVPYPSSEAERRRWRSEADS